MSFSVPQSYVEQFSETVHMLSEQKMSRLMGRVMMESVNAESFAIERLDSVEAEIVADLHGDTPLTSTPHSRRWGFVKTYDVADLLDNESQVKLLIDPMSRYTMKHAAAMGRSMDTEILRALGGNAAQGKDGGTIVALPAAQQFNATGGSSEITLNDLIEAKRRLDRAEVDEMFPRTCVLDAGGFSQLLRIAQIQNADFNTVRALTEGRVNSFMGFDFVRTELITGANTSAAKGIFFAMPAVTMGVGAAPSSAVDMRPDKRRSQQVYTWGNWGAVRVEDEMVVEITYDATQ